MASEGNFEAWMCTCRPPSPLPMPANALRVVPPSTDAASPVEAVRYVVAAGSALSMCLITSDFPVPESRQPKVFALLHTTHIRSGEVTQCVFEPGRHGRTSTASEEDALARQDQVGHPLLFWGQRRQRLTVLRIRSYHCTSWTEPGWCSSIPALHIMCQAVPHLDHLVIVCPE